MKNRMFEEMLKAARVRLNGRDPKSISMNAKILFDEEKSLFLVNSFGSEINISYPDYIVKDEIDEWHLLTILHYMDIADGSSVTGKLISFSQIKDGLVRGGAFDKTAEKEFEKILKNVCEEKIEFAIKSLGGVQKTSKADFCVEIPFLPMYALTLNIWFADDEYPASGKLLLDESADHYLTIEDAVTVGDIFLRRLSEAIKSSTLEEKR